MPPSKDGKKAIIFSDAEFYDAFFEKLKKKKKKLINVGARHISKIFAVTISNHLLSSQFLPISGQFGRPPKNKNCSIQSKKISCSRGNNFLHIFRGKTFLKLFNFFFSKKKLFLYIIKGWSSGQLKQHLQWRSININFKTEDGKCCSEFFFTRIGIFCPKKMTNEKEVHLL